MDNPWMEYKAINFPSSITILWYIGCPKKSIHSLNDNNVVRPINRVHIFLGTPCILKYSSFSKIKLIACLQCLQIIRLTKNIRYHQHYHHVVLDVAVVRILSSVREIMI